MEHDPTRDVRYCSFGGVIASQRFVDFYMWEGLLNSHPEIDTTIVEIGTDRGGMSLFLQAQARVRGLGFVTFDIVYPEKMPLELEHDFCQLDVFSERGVTHLGWLFATVGPCFLFCDGGDKPRELRELTPLCADGTIVVVHDWGTEVGPTDVPPWLEEIHTDFTDGLGSMSRVFIKRGEPDGKNEG